MSTGEAADEHFVYEYNCGLWQGGLTSEFPRRDYHLSVGCFGFPPYGPGQGKREVVWAARRASLSWCSLMLEEAERTGIPEDEIRVAVDDTCFALAVFDKVWETYVIPLPRTLTKGSIFKVFWTQPRDLPHCRHSWSWQSP